jgi:hypothetical protein
MPAEIVLPAGTDKVYFRDMAALFARAAIPDIPEHTPRTVVNLKKFPLTETAANQMCGKDRRPFAVPLTEGDLSTLAQQCWKNLPPLTLPIKETDWLPYIEAFKKKPPSKVWKLCADIEDEYDENQVSQALVKMDWKELIDNAVKGGELIPTNPTTLIPTPSAKGNLLRQCFVSVREFTEFAARLKFRVRITGHVHGIWHDSYLTTEQHAKYMDERSIARAKGRYSIGDAAIEIVAYETDKSEELYSNQQLRERRMFEKLKKAVLDSTLTVYAIGESLRFENPSWVRIETHCEAYWNDLNEWLDRNEKQISFRFPPPVALQAAPAESNPESDTNKQGRPRTIQTTTMKRSDELTAVIATAKNTAQNSGDYQSVWAELVKLAESENPPAPLIGFTDGEGVKYRSESGENGVKFFTKRNLSDRMRRAMRR